MRILKKLIFRNRKILASENGTKDTQFWDWDFDRVARQACCELGLEALVRLVNLVRIHSRVEQLMDT